MDIYIYHLQFIRTNIILYKYQLNRNLSEKSFFKLVLDQNQGQFNPRIYIWFLIVFD